MAPRRSLRFRKWSTLRDAVVDAIGTTVFGVAAVRLTGLGLGYLIVERARR